MEGTHYFSSMNEEHNNNNNNNIIHIHHKNSMRSSHQILEFSSEKNSSSSSSLVLAPTDDHVINEANNNNKNNDQVLEKDLSGRERLKKHREEIAGHVVIPDSWAQENFLKDWIDCSSFDKLLAPNGIASARRALVSQGHLGQVLNG